MAKKLYEESKIAAIGEKIREKTGGEGRYTTAEMPSGVEEVFEAGKEAERDAFWDAYQENGNEDSYAYAFAGKVWNDETFNPPNKLTLKGECDYCFYNNKCTTIVGKVEKIIPTALSFGFGCSAIKHICPIDLSNCTRLSSLSSSFASSEIVSIEKIISSATTAWHASTFKGASRLESVIFEGVIAESIDFSLCVRLNKASITSIVNALSDTATGKTLTLQKIAALRSFVRTVYCDMEAKTWEDNGITYTCDGNGTFTINGTCNSEGASFMIPFPTPSTAGEIWLVDSGIPYDDIFVRTLIYHPDGTEEGGTDINAWSFTTQVGSIINMSLHIQEGQTFENYAFTPTLGIFTEEWDELKATKPNWTISLV